MTQHTALVDAVQRVLQSGVSMRGLAKTAGVSQATISGLMSGEAKGVTLKTYERLMSAAESDMKKPVTTHDHAAASLEAIEQAALERGVDADVGLRDDALECAKHRRVMALEAELDAWQLKCGKDRDKAEKLQWSLNKSEALAHVYSKDLQIMTASWKAVSVERDTLERSLSHRDRHLKSCENALIEAHGERDDLKLECGNLRGQLEQADLSYTTLHKDASRAKSVAWASGIALLLIVVQAAFMVFGGAS